MTDPVERLAPGLRVGERVTLLVASEDCSRDVLGFVTALDDASLTVVDRRGTETTVARASVLAGKRMGVALGRDPRRTPPAELDAHAARAGAFGTPYVARISDLLAGLPFPAAVPARGEWAEPGGVRARCEGEWVTLASPPPAPSIVDAARAAAWWATRWGARSVQVRTSDAAAAAALEAAGFTRAG